VPSTQFHLSRTAQRWADEALAALSTSDHLKEHSSLEHLCRWLDEEWRLVDCINDQSNWVHAPTLAQIVNHAWQVFEGPEDHEAVLACLHKTAQEALAGDSSFWGDEYSVVVGGQLEASTGSVAVLAFEFSHLDEPVNWYGLFRDGSALRAWLGRQGRYTTLEEFERTPRGVMLRKWGAQGTNRVDG